MIGDYKTGPLDPAELVELLKLDPDGPPIFAQISGRKGCGKSTFLRKYASSWPYDEILVDPTRDVDPDHSFTRPWPGGDEWPQVDEEEDRRWGHRRFRIVPDREHDPMHREKVDRAILLAHKLPEPVFIGLDESRYLFASDDKILVGSDIVQNEGRHGPDFLFMSNPRTVGIRPIVRFQADWLVIFALDGNADMKALADAAGIPADELAKLLAGLEREALGAPRGEVVTGFVLVDKPREIIAVYPILP